MDLDLAINNGTVVDGTGRAGFRAHVGVRGDKIAAVATGEPLGAREAIDASGLVVSPGFIDIHSHMDWNLPYPDHDQLLAPFVLQGVTTLVTGNCGSGPAPVTEQSIPVMYRLYNDQYPYRWRSVGEFLDVLEHDGVLLNTAFLVGHGILRCAVMGERAESSAPTSAELAALRELARRSLRDGAFGFSTGLGYTPGMFAPEEELLSLLRMVAEEGAIHAVHSRAYACVSAFYERQDVPHNVLSNREQLDWARRTGARLQLAHLIVVGRRTWPTYTTILQDIDRAASDGVDVAFDAFPHTFGQTTIRVMFPAWFLKDLHRNLNDASALARLKPDALGRMEAIGRGFRDIRLMYGVLPEFAELEGLDFSAIAERLGMAEFDAYVHIARQSKGKARILHGPFSGDDDYQEPLRAILSHPLCSFETDTAIFRQGVHHPATFGTFPRVLGRYCRGEGLFSLEEAIRRMTSFSAERIGLKGVGQVAEDYYADLTVFDPATVADNATAERADAPPTGIESVLISGNIVARNGRMVGTKRSGRVLRR